MNPQLRPPPPEYLSYLQYHLVKQREAVLSDVLDSLGLTTPKWRILSILNRLGESSMGLVADFCAIDRTTLTRTTDQLVDAGLVVRTDDPRDRRQTLVTLTPAGVDAYQGAVAAVMAFNDKALKGVSSEDRKVLEVLLHKVVHNVIDDAEWADCILRFDRATTE